MSLEDHTPIDPRIQVELEKLNVATENINKYEIELDEAKTDFRKLLKESVDRLKQLAGKLENSILMSKPYYDARLDSSQVIKKTQEVAGKYEKARSFNTAAKEMVYLAEQGLGKKTVLDTACQEMLSHATSRVNETQQQCVEMEHMLKISELKQEMAANKVSSLQSQLKAAIKSSRPYYETRANNIGILNEQKQKIFDLEAKVSETKMNYNETLRCLELISEEIHKMRDEKYKLLNTHYKNHHAQEIANERIDFTDEYLDFPVNLSPDSDTNSDIFHRSQGYSQIENGSNFTVDDTNENEKWTEIMLSDPYSGTSGNSPNSNDNKTFTKSDLDDDDDEEEDSKNCGLICENNKKYPESLTNWITKTNLKNKERRQSLDILYDAGDRVKDAFTQGIQKVGKTLERRNSESEASLEFFLFNRSENLSDEQVENLNLNRSISSIYEDYLTIIK